MAAQAGRFDTEEDVLRYMLDPFPWLLMAVYQLDQEHKIAGSVIEAPAKTADSGAATTDGESTGKNPAPKKMAKVKKGQGGHGPKKQDQSAQKDKTIAMLKVSLAKSQAELAQLRGGAPPPTKQATKQEPPPAAANGKPDHKKKPKTPAKQRPVSPPPATGQPTQEPAPAHSVIKPGLKKEPVSHVRQHPASPQPAERAAPPEAGSPLKRPPPLHVMAQRASALSPGRTRSSGGNQGSECLYS